MFKKKEKPLDPIHLTHLMCWKEAWAWSPAHQAWQPADSWLCHLGHIFISVGNGFLKFLFFNHFQNKRMNGIYSHLNTTRIKDLVKS